MSIDYKPQAGSLAEKLISFFTSCPDEELTRKDIAEKFDVMSTSIDNSLKTATEHGLITTTNNQELVRVWVAGRNLKEFSAPPNSKLKGFKAYLAKKGKTSAEGLPPLKQLPKPGELLSTIEAGIPFPTSLSRGHEYHEVWQQMESGDSVLLATEAAKRLIYNAQRYGKAFGRKFVMRQIDSSNSRIWRTK